MHTFHSACRYACSCLRLLYAAIFLTKPCALLQLGNISVFYKQRACLFYPVMAFTMPTILLRIPLSIVLALVYALLSYFTVGFAPDAGRHGRCSHMLVAVCTCCMVHFACILTCTLMHSLCCQELPGIAHAHPAAPFWAVLLPFCMLIWQGHPLS